MAEFRQYNSGSLFLTVGLCVAVGVGFWALGGSSIAWGQLVTSPNQPPPGRVDNSASTYRPINTQLYITGQVTGLRSFRGEVGYRAPNELRTNVPSAEIGVFLRQSVGLPDVLAGRNYLPHAYFDRSLTAWPAGGILAGRTAVTADFSRTSRGTPARTAQMPAGAKPQFYDPAGIYSQAFPQMARPQPPSVPSLRTKPPIITFDIMAELARIMVQAPIEIELPSRPYEIVKPSEQAKLAAELAKLVPVKSEIDARVGKMIDFEVDAAVDATPKGLEPVPVRKQIELVPGLGDDAFIELLEKLRARREKEALEEQTAPKKPGRRQRLPEPDMDQEGLDQLPPADRQKSKRAAIEFTPGGDVVIRSFAGSHEDWFNLNLKKAADHLAHGRYYAASRQYKLAIKLNQENPMARLGLCLSLFGAGEPRTAGLSLYRAMILFEPIGETRLDIAFMMDEAIFARRLDMLEHQIQRGGSDVPVLVYLTAVFMHRSAGQDFRAQEYARKLLESAGGDQLLTRYANFVLTGRRHATTAPAQ